MIYWRNSFTCLYCDFLNNYHVILPIFPPQLHFGYLPKKLQLKFKAAKCQYMLTIDIGIDGFVFI